MPMSETIRAKRKELGLTQEQVADYLGVSAPAVNKWEKGATCPDITLLPALARLLGTDVNTLLGFHEGLSPRERGNFQRAVVESMKKEGFPKGFEQAMEKVREYPGSGELLHETAMLLDGALMMYGADIADKAPYEERILSLYVRAADCGEGPHRDGAIFMLASKYLARDECEKARALLGRLPEWTALDKRQLQAEVLLKEGKPDEAAEIQEQRLRGAVNLVQTVLLGMVGAELKKENGGDATRFAEVYLEFARLFGMNEYTLWVAPFEVAVARRDAAESLDLLKKMLSALRKPWRQDRTLLFRYVPEPEKQDDGEMGRNFLPMILAELETGEQYDFLRQEPEFGRILQAYGRG